MSQITLIAWGWLAALGLVVALQLVLQSVEPLYVGAGVLVGLLMELLVPQSPLWAQVLACALVSGALFMATYRRVGRRLQRGPAIATNVDRLIGQRAVVTEAIDNDAALGQVRIGAETWSARSADDQLRLGVGEIVMVRSIQGVFAIIAPPGDPDPAGEV